MAAHRDVQQKAMPVICFLGSLSAATFSDDCVGLL
jgi:hypothetical protein